jgi:hypothetical protein
MHRRSLLAGLVALVAAACGVRRDDAPTVAPSPPVSPSPSPSPPDPAPADDPSPTPDVEEPPGEDPADGLPDAPDPAPPYEPVAAETHPNAKALGALVAQTLTTADPGEPLEAIVERASDGRGRTEDVEAARPLHHPDGWSRGEVLYPQFGGLTEGRCSIMAVTRQTLGYPDGAVEEVVRTIDVRLRIVDGGWTFESLASAGGTPVDRPDDLPEAATAVLDDPRIELPDSARWDIHRGATSPALLALLGRLADETGGFAVCVLESGHPVNVFGTDRLSDHTRGRAADLHALGGRLVIEDRQQGSGTDRAVGWLYDDPIRPVVGSPWALDGFGGRSFTDAVHQDHLHVAVPRAADEGDPPPEELAP